VICGYEIKFYTRKEREKDRKVIRCIRKDCQKTQSVRKGNTIFTDKDRNGKCNSGLSLSQILELAYYWCIDIPLITIGKVTGRGSHTICDWMNLCRDITKAAFEKRGKMGGNNIIVQVDECLIRGKRKYNQGRLLGADKMNENINIEDLSDEEDYDFNNRNNGKN